MMREEVKLFAEAMEERLQENDDKHHWSNYTPAQMFERLKNELEELTWAFGSDEKRHECVDVANFAMMIWDLEGDALKERERVMSEHKWTLSEGSGVYCVTHHDRACMMSNAEAIVILNEHAQLKAELVLYKKVTTMPKLLWDLQAENERLKTDLEWWKGLAGQLEMEVREDALKEKP